MTRVLRGVHRVRARIGTSHHGRTHGRHGSEVGGFKDLSALPVCGCGAGVRPLWSQRALRTP